MYLLHEITIHEIKDKSKLLETNKQKIITKNNKYFSTIK